MASLREGDADGVMLLHFDTPNALGLEKSNSSPYLTSLKCILIG